MKSGVHCERLTGTPSAIRGSPVSGTHRDFSTVDRGKIGPGCRGAARIALFYSVEKRNQG